MHKVLVFDLDGTLAKIGEGIKNDDILLLKQLEKSGYKIVICSGKPTYYLCGFARQLQLNQPILVGENGASIQFGIDLPPQKHFHYACCAESLLALDELKKSLTNLLGDNVWFQPNEVVLTAFPYKQDDFSKIEALYKSFCLGKKVNVFRHVDSFDFVPDGINKFNGLHLLSEKLQISKKDFVAIGDGENDLPMFEFADFSISIGNALKDKSNLNFDSITKALEYILKNNL